MSVASNAPDGVTAARRFRIIHPFHPLYGREFPLVTIRHNWGEDRVYYHDEQGRLMAVPADWTDAVPLDPAVMVSAGRSLFRLQDLLELARLLEALGQEADHAC